MKLISLASAVSAQTKSFIGDVVYRLENVDAKTIDVLRKLNSVQTIDFWFPESEQDLREGQTVDLHLENAQRLVS